MSVLKNLNRAIDQKMLISLYTNKEDPEHFSAGVPVCFVEDWLVLKAVTPEGFYDGYILKKLDDVYKVEYNSKYEICLAKLVDFRGNHGESFDLKKSKTLEDFLQNNANMISVFTSAGGDFLGQVLKVHNDELEMRTYDFYGEPGKYQKINFSELKSIKLNGIEEKNVGILV